MPAKHTGLLLVNSDHSLPCFTWCISAQRFVYYWLQPSDTVMATLWMRGQFFSDDSAITLCFCILFMFLCIFCSSTLFALGRYLYNLKLSCDLYITQWWLPIDLELPSDLLMTQIMFILRFKNVNCFNLLFSLQQHTVHCAGIPLQLFKIILAAIGSSFFLALLGCECRYFVRLSWRSWISWPSKGSQSVWFLRHHAYLCQCWCWTEDCIEIIYVQDLIQVHKRDAAWSLHSWKHWTGKG